MASTLQGDSATCRVKTAAAELGLQLTKQAIANHATRLVKTERAGLSTNKPARLSKEQAKELRLMASTLQGDSATCRVKTAAAQLGLELTESAIGRQATIIRRTESALKPRVRL